MLNSLIVTNGENLKEIEEPSLTALGDLDWNDPVSKLIFLTKEITMDKNCIFPQQYTNKNKKQLQ